MCSTYACSSFASASASSWYSGEDISACAMAAARGLQCRGGTWMVGRRWDAAPGASIRFDHEWGTVTKSRQG